MKKTYATKLLAVVVALVFTLGIYSGFLVAVDSGYLLSNSGSLITFGSVTAYWDSNFTAKISQIDWGIISPGSERNITIFLHNDGDLPITLAFSVSNWDPVDCSSYLSLNWTYFDGQIINPDDSLPVTLTLFVAANTTDIGEFSFSTIISGITL